MGRVVKIFGGFAGQAVVLLLAIVSCGKLNGTSERPFIDGSLESFISCNPAMDGVTKAAHTAAIPDQFHIWGYITGESLYDNTPNYMVGETFTKQAEKVNDKDVWTSAHKFGSVPAAYKVKFWAFAPKDATGVSGLPSASTSGAPSFSYALPASSASQADLIAALSSEYSGYSPGTSANVSLTFKHLLSSFSFSTGSESIPACTINSISITGVPTSATYTEGSGWSGHSGSGEISVSPAKTLEKNGYSVNISGDDYLLALPGTAISSANCLKINMTIGADTKTITVPFSGSGFTLEAGYNYNLALTFPAVSTVTITVTIDPWNEQQKTLVLK